MKAGPKGSVFPRHDLSAVPSEMLASQAGAQILSRGGSAVNAAIAANAILGTGAFW